MSANFSNMRLRYKHLKDDLPTKKKNLVLVLNLSSLNFDINHSTIGNSTPFTSELSFELAFEDNALSKLNFKDIQSLANLLDEHFPVQSITESNPINKITNLLLGVEIDDLVFEGVFIDKNLELQFHDLDITATSSTISNTSIQVLASPNNSVEGELFELTWSVKIKFHADSPDGGDAAVLYPKINFPIETLVPLASEDVDDLSKAKTLDAFFNDQLRLNYELTYLPDQLAASPIGRATDELSDSLSNLTTTIANNLSSTIKTQLQPPGNFFSKDVALWVLIKKGTDELSFSNFFNYMEAIFCGENNYNAGHISSKAEALDRRRSLPFMHVDAYRAVKIATEAFVMVNCMVKKGFTAADIEELRKRVRLVNGVPDEKELTNFFIDYKESVNGGISMIPYLAVIRRKLSNDGIKVTSFEDAFDRYIGTNGADADTCYGVISDKLTSPCFLELIWSYWHEESMMVQGLNAVCRRFQNIRGPGQVDPLANMEIDALRPLNNLMWGYIQDHQHRLSVRRRAYEYNHHYGISLKGEAAKEMRFADPRSKFIEALHTLLNLASRFFKQSDDMTVRPDGFPILNGLRETHLILSEGAHNQYGDLPSTARAEMLMEQWLLSRPEFREFLPTRVMVAYPEPWMDRVAALNQMLGNTKTSVLHFNYLAIFGEKILLSIRFGNWADPANTADVAANWANFWRPEIQAYIHAYRAATGVDLSADGVAAGQRVDAQQPSVHLFRKLAEQQNGNGQMSKTAAKAIVK